MRYNSITLWTSLLLASGEGTLSCHTLPDHMTPLQGHYTTFCIAQHTAILAACFWIPRKEHVMERSRNSFQAFPRCSTLASGWGMWITSRSVLIVSLIWRMKRYGGAFSEMTQVLAQELSSDHLAKLNSLPLNQSLKVLIINNPPYQLYLQDAYLGDRQPVFCPLSVLA